MTDDDVQLARDVLSETLHGPVPIATVARLAEAVLRLDAERQWRPLTDHPKTWPEEGQWVLLWDGTAAEDWRWLYTAHSFVQGWTHWLPLPEPPKGEGDV